jgi:hypothetical protein
MGSPAGLFVASAAPVPRGRRPVRRRTAGRSHATAASRAPPVRDRTRRCRRGSGRSSPSSTRPAARCASLPSSPTGRSPRSAPSSIDTASTAAAAAPQRCANRAPDGYPSVPSPRWRCVGSGEVGTRLIGGVYPRLALRRRQALAPVRMPTFLDRTCGAEGTRPPDPHAARAAGGGPRMSAAVRAAGQRRMRRQRTAAYNRGRRRLATIVAPPRSRVIGVLIRPTTTTEGPRG